MKFDSVIIGGGLAGLTAGILLQSKGQKTAIVSSGQSALHFFSGTFETIQELPRELADVFSGAGIRVHSEEGVRLMPMGTFRDAALSLEDIGIFPDKKIGKKILIVNITGYHDFFAGFLADGLEKEGAQCRVRFVRLPELDSLRQSPSEMRSVQIARVLDAAWEKFAREVRLLLNDDDTVILPQVFGLADASIPGKLREAIPANLVFAGTLPPSVPGVRTQMQLKRRYQVLGGTFLMGDTVLEAHVHDGVVHSVVTKNLEHNYLEADIFILASGGYFSKGLVATPYNIYEPVFGLDVQQEQDRNSWYEAAFEKDQPYMSFGVNTDENLHPLKDGEALKNLYAIGSVLGKTRPEFGEGAGAALRTALKAVNNILA